jgi:AraC-like DNA-binding protein
LIEQSEDSISEIAMKCGFDNLSYFSKVFFQVKNRRPIDYKKEMQLRK